MIGITNVLRLGCINPNFGVRAFFSADKGSFSSGVKIQERLSSARIQEQYGISRPIAVQIGLLYDHSFGFTNRFLSYLSAESSLQALFLNGSILASAKKTGFTGISAAAVKSINDRLSSSIAVREKIFALADEVKGAKDTTEQGARSSSSGDGIDGSDIGREGWPEDRSPSYDGYVSGNSRSIPSYDGYTGPASNDTSYDGYTRRW